MSQMHLFQLSRHYIHLVIIAHVLHFPLLSLKSSFTDAVRMTIKDVIQ